MWQRPVCDHGEKRCGVDEPSEVRQGYLESSNVDLASEMGKVIEAQRTHSYVLRMMQTADEIETTVNNLTNG